MFHLNGSSPGFYHNGVGDKVGLSVPSNGDHIGELEESADYFFPELGVPLKEW